MKLPKLFQRDKARVETGLSIKKVSIARTPTSVTKIISRKYKFHVLKERLLISLNPQKFF